jgi:hypothetical protein
MTIMLSHDCGAVAHPTRHLVNVERLLFVAGLKLIDELMLWSGMEAFFCGLRPIPHFL